MYAKLGIHWAAALPGFIALACIPFTVLFYKYGGQIRAKCKYAADAERQMAAIMAARAAASKRDEEDNLSTYSARTHTDEPNVGGATAGITGAKEAQTFPAEQAGGIGPTAEEGEKEIADEVAKEKGDEQSRHPSHPIHPDHHEWTMYEVLADRDEVDLEDDEKRRLWELHGRFEGVQGRKMPKSQRPAADITEKQLIANVAEERDERMQEDEQVKSTQAAGPQSSDKRAVAGDYVLAPVVH